MRVGIAFDLKSDHEAPEGRDDLLEEYDCEETINAIKDQLEAEGHEVLLLHSGERFINAILNTPVDIVFNIAEGAGGRCREAHIPAVCEMLSIPYTHSDPLALALSLDKHLAIRVVKSAGIPVPEQILVEKSEQLTNNNFPLPAIVKPVHEGSSMGITNTSFVTSGRKLTERAKELVEMFNQPVVVEEFLPGTELTVGIVGNNPPEIIGIMEISPAVSCENFIYSMETKRNHQKFVSYYCPPKSIDKSTICAVEEIAMKAYRVVGCRDVARVDVRISREGKPKFLEINPLPGLNPHYSDLCIMCSLSGISYYNLIMKIFHSACDRLKLQHEESKDKKARKQRYGGNRRADKRLRGLS